jgi:branched-chain amino acid transport system ATP-binding protein
MAEAILRTDRLTKKFGGLTAVGDVSLAVEAGRIHAVIGPNGAGKTTLLNLLSGELRPSFGRVWFAGQEITGASPDRVSRRGIGRSFQRTNVFAELTCLENCWIAAQSRLKTSMRFFRPARRLDGVRREAERVLEVCGLAARRDTAAAAMSHGERRQLEIAMMLATRPRLMLMDEPLAGMGTRESEHVVALLRELARDTTIVLIEHDMDAVFSVADAITVMVNGRVLESGPPAHIRASAEVRKAYLGEEAQAA